MAKRDEKNRPPSEPPRAPGPSRPLRTPAGHVTRTATQVPAGHNTLIVRLHDQSFVAVCAGGREVVREAAAVTAASFALEPGEYEIATDGTVDEMKSESRSRPAAPTAGVPGANVPGEVTALRITCDAEDRNVVDGVPEIASGKDSFCEVTVEVPGAGDAPVELHLRTTGGTLKDADGKKRIRTLELTGGKGSFRLYADEDPRVVTVSVFGASVSPARLDVEFI